MDLTTLIFCIAALISLGFIIAALHDIAEVLERIANALEEPKYIVENGPVELGFHSPIFAKDQAAAPDRKQGDD